MVNIKKIPTAVKQMLVKDGRFLLGPRRNGYIILCYHSVGVREGYRYALAVQHFEEHMAYLTSFFKLATLKEIIEKIPSADSWNGIEVAVTFDDGFLDTYTNALPLLVKYNVPVTIFISTSLPQSGYQTFLNWENIREMAGHPLVTFESHGHTHSPLNALDKEDVLYELTFSKKELEFRTNKSVDVFSYPFGIFNDQTVKMVKESGYLAALCAGVDQSQGRDLWRMNRLVIDETHTTLADFAYALAMEATVL